MSEKTLGQIAFEAFRAQAAYAGGLLSPYNKATVPPSVAPCWEAAANAVVVFLKTENARLRQFAQAILEIEPPAGQYVTPGNMPGTFIEAKAVEFGLLVAVHPVRPCGPDCQCAEEKYRVNEEGFFDESEEVDCLRPSSILTEVKT